MSADLYSDLTTRLAMKNYPKKTLHMSQSAQWFQSYRLRKVCWVMAQVVIQWRRWLYKHCNYSYKLQVQVRLTRTLKYDL